MWPARRLPPAALVLPALLLLAPGASTAAANAAGADGGVEPQPAAVNVSGGSIDGPPPAAAPAKAEAEAALESNGRRADAEQRARDAQPTTSGAGERLAGGETDSALMAPARDGSLVNNASLLGAQPNRVPVAKVIKSVNISTATSYADSNGLNTITNESSKENRDGRHTVSDNGTVEGVPRILTHGTSGPTIVPSAGNADVAGSVVNEQPASSQDDRDYTDPLIAVEADDAGGVAGAVEGAGEAAGGSLLEAAGARLQRLLGAAQEAAEALAEVPRQLWLLPIRLGFYPGLTRQQDAIPRLAPFPCAAATRDAQGRQAPDSVHRLRPGDVRVVAALGDSLTAANGALAYTEEETRLNYRGVSAYGGGQGTWREYMTLPNVLKEFNPKLLGYALGVAEAGEARAGLNLARNGALDDELPAQARRLVRALRQHPYVHVERDWKLVNLLVGGNDLCNEYCYSEGGRHSPEGHARALRATLDHLQRHLPRTLVNLVHIPNLLQLRSMRNVPFACHLKQLVLCSCLFGGAERAKAESVGRMLRGYWRAEREIAEDPRYDSDNFTVVLQPFFLGVDFPDAVSTWFGEAPDLSYFAPDCFHFSQKGNALAANALWNNMLEPEGRKSLGWRPLMQRFLCPNASAPYFFTRRNTRTFLQTGRQD